MKSIIFLFVVLIGIPAYAADAQTKTTKQSPPSPAAIESKKREQAVKNAREKREKEDLNEGNKARIDKHDRRPAAGAQKGKKEELPLPELDKFDMAVINQIKLIKELTHKAEHAKTEKEAKMYRDQAEEERRTLERMPQSDPKRKKK
jgi:hypothetical protein